LRKQIKKDYEIFIMNKVRLEKTRAKAKWHKRKDYEGTLMVVDHVPAAEQVQKDPSDSSDGTADETFGPTDLVERLIRKFDRYETETRNVLECYDKLEREHDEIKIRCQQSE